MIIAELTIDIPQCLENWQGFSLTSYERSNYMKGLERQLEKDPEDQELILKVSKCKTIA